MPTASASHKLLRLRLWQTNKCPNYCAKTSWKFLLDIFRNQWFEQLNYKKIEAYETKIGNNSSLSKEYFNIDYVYMHSIILDIAKLIGATGNEKGTLTGLYSLAPANLRKDIDELRLKNEIIFKKIENNRNKIIAHVDVSDFWAYFNMGFSQLEIDRRIQDFMNYLELTGQETKTNLDVIENLKNLKSTSVQFERYSPADFGQDLNRFKSIINEILDITTRANSYFYNQR